MGQGSWAMEFPPEPASASAARYAVREAIGRAHVAARTLDAVDLVVGEFAANAIGHARTDFVVTVRLVPSRIRVEVFDGDTRPPIVLGPDTDSTSGRGLQIVSGLAEDWGWRRATLRGLRGKVVWASWTIGEPPDRDCAGK
jgi:anti-sigma regulatory factor (Ser/Thr protein kinase)